MMGLRPTNLWFVRSSDQSGGICLPSVTTSFVPVTLTFPTCIVKGPSSTEVTFMLSVENRAIVFVIDTVAIVALPCRVGVIGIAGEIPFGDTELCFYAHLRVCGVCYQASGNDHGEDE